MESSRPIHPDFLAPLMLKNKALADLFFDLRAFMLEQHPECNELLYHTHALTTVFSLSEKLGNAYCMIPIYTNHLNLGFNKGTLLKDPHQLLSGTGNLIRHIDVTKPSDYRSLRVKALVKEAVNFALKEMDKPVKSTGLAISKIGVK